MAIQNLMKAGKVFSFLILIYAFVCLLIVVNEIFSLSEVVVDLEKGSKVTSEYIEHNENVREVFSAHIEVLLTSLAVIKVQLDYIFEMLMYTCFLILIAWSSSICKEYKASKEAGE